jgi:hypothetical protein
MKLRLALLGLLVMAPAARGQTMLDAAAAGAIQGSLQGGSTPSYLGALQRSRQALSGPSGATGASGQGQVPAGASPMNVGVPLQAGAMVAPPTTATFRVNGRVIELCPSGLPCMGQIRRAMGLR